MNKKILFLTLLAILALPVIASAQTIATMAEAVAVQVVAVGRWIVVIMWIATGIIFLTAQEDPGKIKLGKTALFASIGGTILILLATGAVTFVANSFELPPAGL